MTILKILGQWLITLRNKRAHNNFYAFFGLYCINTVLNSKVFVYKILTNIKGILHKIIVLMKNGPASGNVNGVK